MDLQLQPFGNINLADPFFDSLKAAYPEFAAPQSFRFVGEKHHEGREAEWVMAITVNG